MKTSICFCLTILSFPVLSSMAMAQPPDLIVHNGKIATVDDKFTLVEAIAVRGERIVAVGENADLLKLAGPATKLLDVGGKTVIPRPV